MRLKISKYAMQVKTLKCNYSDLEEEKMDCELRLKVSTEQCKETCKKVKLLTSGIEMTGTKNSGLKKELAATVGNKRVS